jgi:hypothetical protein
VSDDKVNNEWWIGKDVEGSGSGIIKSPVPTLESSPQTPISVEVPF